MPLLNLIYDKGPYKANASCNSACGIWYVFEKHIIVLFFTYLLMYSWTDNTILKGKLFNTLTVLSKARYII